MKRIIALALTACLLLSSCGMPSTQTESSPSQTAEQIDLAKPTEATPSTAPTVEPPVVAEPLIEFTQLSDPDLLPYIEDTLYESLVTTLDSEDYFVENVSAVYYSKEYMEEVAYNSQENIYFGYTLSELDEQFEGTRYVFAVDESGQTVAQPFEGYDDSYDQMISNVVTGSGVILVCVTVSVATGGTAPAISTIFAVSAKAGAIGAVSGGAFGGVVAGVCTGLSTGDTKEALKAAALAGSDGFKWGAITGGIVGGAERAVALKGATLGGLTMNQAAQIQKESKYPLEVIKKFSSMEQYELCKKIGLKSQIVNGKASLVQAVDLNFTDELGRTNLQRMASGKPPLDATGQSYELHHLGQTVDSPLAILTKAQHVQDGNNKIWHLIGEASDVHKNASAWAAQKAAYWRDFAKLIESGVM